ncbi:MAG: ABC transporter permease [Pikeienuella sp.]
MDLTLPLQHWELFAEGVWVTLHLTALALLIGFAISVPCALAQVRGSRLAPIVRAYVYVFRGTPLIVQTYLIYYGLSQFDTVRDSVFWDAPGWVAGGWLEPFWPSLKSAWWCAVIAFSLNSGAYQTEILRGALATTPAGEIEGARALGLSQPQVTRLVWMPSAMRRALPQYGNEVVFMLHGSVVASVITLQDILGAGRTLNAKYYLAYEGLVTAALLYMCVTFAIVLVFRLIERRYLRHLKIEAHRPSSFGAAASGGLDPASAR